MNSTQTKVNNDLIETYNLREACEKGDVEKVKKLIKSGIDVNHCWTYEQRPIHIASIKGQEKVVNLLLQLGSYIDPVDKYGITPLANACCSGDLPTIKLLISAGANVNNEDVLRETPLFSVDLVHDNTSIFKLLTESGANLNHRNKFGMTIFDKYMQHSRNKYISITQHDLKY